MCGTMNNQSANSPTETLTASDEILDKRELASRLKLSVRTVDCYMRQGKLPFCKLGKTVRFRWLHVLEKLSACRVN